MYGTQTYTKEFDITAGRHGGNPESAAANEAVRRFKEELRRKIWLWFRDNGPAITEAAALALSLRMSTASARVSELRKGGCLVPTGTRRRTTSGCFAAVLQIGREWVAD